MMTEIKKDVKVLSSAPGPMFPTLKPVVPSSCLLPALLSCLLPAPQSPEPRLVLQQSAKLSPVLVKNFFSDFVDPISFSQCPQ